MRSRPRSSNGTSGSCVAAKKTTIGVRIGSAAPASGRVFHQSPPGAGGNVAKSARTRGQANSTSGSCVEQQGTHHRHNKWSSTCSGRVFHQSPLWQERSLSTSIIVKSSQSFAKEAIQIRVPCSQGGNSFVDGPSREASICAGQEKIMHRSQCQIG